MIKSLYNYKYKVGTYLAQMYRNETSITQSLYFLGFEQFGTQGDKVKFDFKIHESKREYIKLNQTVTIILPGWMFLENKKQVIVQKALVAK